MTSDLATRLRALVESENDCKLSLDDYALAAGAAAATLALRLDEDRSGALSAVQEPLERGLFGPYLDALTGAAAAVVWELTQDDPEERARIVGQLQELAAGWHENRDHPK